MRTTGFQRTALRAAILVCWFACVWTPDLFGQLMIPTQSPLADGVIGTAYSQTLTATGGVVPSYTWTLVAGQGNLPAGLSLSSGGVISGMPTAAGTSNFRVRVTNLQQSVEKNFTIQISPPVVINTASPLLSGMVGTAYLQMFSGSGGDPPYTWTLASGSLPGGFTLTPSGNLTGTPTSAGTANFTVRLTDSSTPAQIITKPMTLVIVPTLSITTASPLPTAQPGTAYSQTLNATGGTSPYTWTLVSALPAGLSLSPGGQISGTPTTAGVTNFTVRATDSSFPNFPVEKAFTLSVIAPLTITSTSPLNTGILGVAYSQTLEASGGTGPYSWSIASGSLPSPLALSSAGVITGTPTGVGSSNVTIRVRDSNNVEVTKPFTVDVVLALIISTASPLPSGVPNVPYSQSFSAAGGIAPYTWNRVGNLPAGLTLSTGGQISGTPTTAGTSNFTIQAFDSSTPPQNFQKPFALSIITALSITTASPMPPATTNVAYSQTLAAAGGTPSFTWIVVPGSGALPAGMSLSPAGVISGTPTTPGTSNFTVRATDSGSPAQTAEKALSIVVSTPLTITTASPMPTGLQGVSYSQTLTATGGTAPYTWTRVSGALPTGLALSNTGVITGEPSELGLFNFTVNVVDSSSPTRSTQGSLQIRIKQFLAITTTSVPGAAVGSSYSVQLQATGDPPLTWSRASGNLPPGIDISAAGLLSGTPTSTGTFDFVVRVTNESPTQEFTRNFQIIVGTAVSVTTATVPQATRFVPYSATLSAAGGLPPFSWSVVSGNLPTGLSLSAAGVIGGTPTVLGTFSFTARAVDSGGGSASRELSITVIPGALQITTPSLPGGIQGFAYRQQFEAAGGPTPYTWTLTTGALPPGFSLTSGGLLQGTPSAPFNGTIVVRVNDSAGGTDQRSFNLVIGPPLGTISLTGLQLTVAPAQQLPIVLSIPAPSPGELRGTLNLAYSSTAVLPVDDPAVQFSTGGRTVTFTIPANTTSAIFPSPLMLVTGTVAGTVAITGSIQNGPSNLALSSTTINSTPPQMTSLAATRLASAVTLRVIGYSPERRVTEIDFSFEVRVNGVIEKVNLSRPVTAEFNTWFQNPASTPFGSAFRFEQLFGVGGDPKTIDAVTVTMKNSQGSTTSARIQLTD